MNPRARVLLLTALTASLPAVASAAFAGTRQVLRWALSPLTSTFASAPEEMTPVRLDPVVSEAGDLRFTVRPDRAAVAADGDGLVRVELSLSSAATAGESPDQATDLVIILDTSGSMAGYKIRVAQAAARQLVSQLEERDRFALVDFDNAGRVVLPLAPVTARTRARAHQEIDALRADGSTHMADGLDQGLALLERGSGRVGRAILVSDGLPNTRNGLEERARLANRAETPLSTVGIGEDFDEALLSTLADAGAGNFYQVRSQEELARLFVEEFDTARATVARNVSVSMALGDGIELVNASGYPVTLNGREADFSVGSLYAGQERRFWVTLRVKPRGEGVYDLGTFQAAAMDVNGARDVASVRPGQVEVTEDTALWLSSLDAEAWGRGVVEEEYNVLRTDVSRFVREGRRDDAIAAIETYHSRNAALNRSVQSTAVTSNLQELSALRKEVDAQFRGEDQRSRQNLWSKSMTSEAYGSRRAGQARGYR